MDKCIICGKSTSFTFEGEGEFKEKTVCPSCQSTCFNTNFNTGCTDNDCNIKIQRPGEQ